MASYLQTGPRRISPFFVPSSIINMVAGNLSIMFGLKGPTSRSSPPAAPAHTTSPTPCA